MPLSKLFTFFSYISLTLLLSTNSAFSQNSTAKETKILKVGDKSYTYKELYELNQAQLYELDKKRYDTLQQISQQMYIDYFFKKLATKNNTTVEKARKKHLEKNIVVTKKEFNTAYNEYKDHKSLAKLSDKEKRKQIRLVLEERAKSILYRKLLTNAMSKKELVLSYPVPKEAKYKMNITPTDVVRYGPKPSDTKPIKCKGDECKITIVEYSDFQCYYCNQVQPAINGVLEKYKGDIRWVIRDFPLNLNSISVPAATAAHCAGKEGKYWFMYDELFKNQSNLDEKKINDLAKKIKLNSKKFAKCIKNNKTLKSLIIKNMDGGRAFGVSGTPAFFVNGLSRSGALRLENFEQAIATSLKKKQ